MELRESCGASGAIKRIGDLMTLFRIRLRSKGHHDAQHLLERFQG
jgi:hypothetical protein